MNNLDQTLPDLMRRATEHLEPEATDLVERGLARGRTLRRRRTALSGATAAVAVLATAGIVTGGLQLFGPKPANESQVAGMGLPAVQVTTTPSPAAKPATPQQTLETLRRLLPSTYRLTQPRTYGDNFIGASYVANDGKGASYVEVQLMNGQVRTECADKPKKVPQTCVVLPDGRTVTASQSGLRGDVSVNSVLITYPDGRSIYLGSANATAMKKAIPTRPQPLLSLLQLRALAENEAWVFPPRGYGKDLGR
ncbi:hypothetical protein [Kribbella sp. NPDC048915]|uniref:hypothetical protein n=1 Tax=Kribbella sp. NPDC048915 TaxID=3155148 RepID=UPI0033EF38F6